MKTYQSDIHAFVGGVQGAGLGSVSARSRKCGGCGGLGLGLVRNHLWTYKLCLLITMSRMGYITIRPNGKCSYIHYLMGYVLGGMLFNIPQNKI